MLVSDTSLGARLDPLLPHWDSRPGYRDAAVLAPLLQADGRDFLVFTQRRPDLKAHAGELSFPGGSREADELPSACALREAQEEIGVKSSQATLLGSLPVAESSFGFRVHPFVARIAADVNLQVDSREVTELVRIPIEELARADRWQWREVSGPRPRTVPFFPFGTVLLWGLTGRLTHDFLQRLGLLAPGRSGAQ